FQRESYAMMTLGITVAIAQVYQQLGTYTPQLLVVRLEETAVGAAVAILAAIGIFPISTRLASGFAAWQGFDMLDALLGQVAARVNGDHERRLTGAARALDNANAQLTTTASPLRLRPARRSEVLRTINLFARLAYLGRNLAADIEWSSPIEPEAASVVGRDVARIRARIDRVRAVISGETRGDDDEIPAAASDGHRESHDRHVLRAQHVIHEMDDVLARLEKNLPSVLFSSDR